MLFKHGMAVVEVGLGRGGVDAGSPEVDAGRGPGEL